MGRVNLGTARIVIIAALFVGGIAVLANGFGDSATVDGPGGGGVGASSTSPSVASPATSPSEPPKETPSPQFEGVLIAVLNGTFEIGLAGQVQQTLEADGYVAAQDPDDAQSKPVAKTVVYFRGGADAAQNRSDAHYLADTYLDGARVALLGSDQGSIAKSAQLVIIVGLDYANANSGA
jgi:hypothetical protein